MDIISSKENETIKRIKKLKEKKYRDQNNEYLIEGIKILKEAINENAKIKLIVICEECQKEGMLDKKLLYEIAKYNCIYVTEKIFNMLTDVTNPQGVLAVIEKNNNSDEINWNQDLIMILDNVQDPGNLGTILRTLDSANLKQVILSNKCGDIYNPKVVRSTMGAIFRVNVLISDDLKTTISQIKENGFSVFGTDLNGASSIYEEKFNKVAVIIGNEANGVEKEILELVDKNIKIPMFRKNRKS